MSAKLEGGLPTAPRSPQHRPGWFVLIAVVMLFGASRLGLGALATLSGADAPSAVDGVLTVSPQEALVRALESATAAAQGAHPLVMQVHAVARLVLAAVMLYAVAAMLLLDPRGRTVAVVTGWLGVVFYVGDVVVALTVLRQAILSASPSILDALSSMAAGGDAGPSRESLLPALRTVTWLFPVLSAAVGVSFFVAVLVCFGGRRGRVLYGLSPEGQGASP